MTEQARQILTKIDEYLKTSTNRNTSRQLRQNRDDIVRTLQAIDQRDFSVAFIGTIGVGKTSAICKVSGLQYMDNNETVDILKTGAGRTTLCEVKIEYASDYSIKVTPLPAAEVQRVVRNFAEFIWSRATNGIANDAEGGNLLSEELTRCIKNLLGLPSIGNQYAKDMALDFFKDCKSVEDVNAQMLARIALGTRTKTEFSPSHEETGSWQRWLKKTFATINDGKDKSVSIPSQITIRGPFPLLIQGGSTWKIVDTRGIDTNIHREDIRKVLDTEGIFPVVCSSFADAPSTDCKSFFDLGVKFGLRSRVERDVILLTLDRNEAGRIADIDDDETDSAVRKNIGRSIREDQISTVISSTYLVKPNIVFHDSKIDSTSAIWDALEARKNAYIVSKHNDLKTLISASQELLSAKTNIVTEFQQDMNDLIEECNISLNARTPDWEHFGDDIKRIFAGVYPKTLAASISRKGEWNNLDIYEAIYQLARSKAIELCKPETDYFKGKLLHLKRKYPSFTSQMDILECNFVTRCEAFSVNVGNIAKMRWIERVKTLPSIWRSMEDEWGRGPGYKNRVIERWDGWVRSVESRALHQSLLHEITTDWRTLPQQIQ